METTQDDM